MQTALSMSSMSVDSTSELSPATSSSNKHSSNENSSNKSSSKSGAPPGAVQGGTPSIRVRFDSSEMAKRSERKAKPAILGNHMAIQNFLQRQLHEPSRFEFAALVNRPGYEASQRLIMQQGAQRDLLAHVHVQPSVMRFGGVHVPTAQLRHFAVYPEYRMQGYDNGLVVAAEREAKRQGAMLCTARDVDPELLGRHGWISLGYDPVSIVSPRRLLGALPRPAEPESPFYGDQMPEYFVRIGRLTDLDAMRELYESHVSSQHGTTIRDDTYWSWLVSRGAHHRIFVYCENDAPRAYVAVRFASVVELVDSTEDGRGAARLLEQVGADAIEQGRYSLRIHAPIQDPVHRWADQADGRLYVGEPQEAWMVKVTSHRSLLRRLAPEMFRRQRRQQVVDNLSIRIGSEEFLIARGVRSMKITRGVAKRHRIGLTHRAAAQLMLGYRSADQLSDTQQLVASTDEAMRTIRVLFPALNLWRSEWDQVPVMHS